MTATWHAKGQGLVREPRAGLKIERLSVSYRGSVAVEAASLSAMPGEIVALVGVNGSGKTTLLRAVAGLAELFGAIVATGRVVVDGKELRSRTFEMNEAVIFCPDGGQVFGDLTVLDNLVCSGRFLGHDMPAAKVRQVRELLSISHFSLERLANHLSGGERQLVAIGRTLLSGARYMLFDEPVSSLSTMAKSNLAGILMRETRDSNRCVIFSEHDIRWVDYLADRIIGLRAGKVEIELAPSEKRLDAILKFLGANN
jgi:ABC-type multidrug transport system ATPase subunit